jgi:hypothetical protein
MNAPFKCSTLGSMQETAIIFGYTTVQVLSLILDLMTDQQTGEMLCNIDAGWIGTTQLTQVANKLLFHSERCLITLNFDIPCRNPSNYLQLV